MTSVSLFIQLVVHPCWRAAV